MLRTKKIMDSVFPQLLGLPTDVVNTFKAANNDNSLLYIPREERSEEDGDGVYCLNCGSKNKVEENGFIRCPKCGNTNIRAPKRQNNHDSPKQKYRMVETVDGYVIIRQMMLCYYENMEGAQVMEREAFRIVLQDNEVGFFENKNLYTEYGAWKRTSKYKEEYYWSKEKLSRTIIADESVYDNDLFASLGTTIHAPLDDVITALIDETNIITGEKAPACPVFRKVNIEYDDNDANIIHFCITQVEPLNGGGNFDRVHYWCSKCGKYSEKTMETPKYGYSGNHCPTCNNYIYRGSPGAEKKSYYLNVQNEDDGNTVIRVSGVASVAVQEGVRTIGVDPIISIKHEVVLTNYIYVTMDGGVYFFDKNGKQINKLEILATGRYSAHTFYISEADENRLRESKSMRRTGFAEYADKMSGKFDVRYLEAKAKIPYLEMFAKMGLSSLADTIMFEDDEKIPAYFKKKDDTFGIKRMSKPQIQALVEGNPDFENMLKYMQVTKKDPTALYSDFTALSRGAHPRHILDILRVGVPGLTLQKIAEYIHRVDDAQCCAPAESMQLWSDYLRMLKRLECDLTDKALIYPNSLKREHDKASRKMSQVRDEKVTEKFMERVEKNKVFGWENDEFLAMLPESVNDLYEEGRKLSHCVGSYVYSVADGNSVIVFVRNKSDKDTPLCTVEVRKKEIVQARGFANKPISSMPKVKQFIYEWAKEKGLSMRAA